MMLAATALMQLSIDILYPRRATGATATLGQLVHADSKRLRAASCDAHPVRFYHGELANHACARSAKVGYGRRVSTRSACRANTMQSHGRWPAW